MKQVEAEIETILEGQGAGMNRDRFFGIGEPLIQREQDTGVPAEAYLELVNALGCRAYRSWMHITECLTDPVTPNEKIVGMHRRLLTKAKELDIEVTGMSHEWFLPAGLQQDKGHAMPPRDLTEGSEYRKTLSMLEQSWETMAALFPEVSVWEIGNEWNITPFLHPVGFLASDMSRPFSFDERMDIAVDMMYYSRRGVKKGNPAAKTTSFSLCLSTPWLGGELPAYLPPMYGIAYSLEAVYRRISSGRFMSADPDDYFDLVAWHPYQMSTNQNEKDKDLFLHIEAPDRLWKDYSEAAYRVMCKYGDKDKQVILSECGFTDCGDKEREQLQAEYTRRVNQLAGELPFVRTMFNFRLLTETGMLQKAGIESNQIGGLPEVYFGFFEEPENDCRPRAKAFALQEMTGSSADLNEAGRRVARMKRI